ncbi:MAG: Gldg family protein [Bacteroidales bacterium]|nr:Gldg family protein [Bacteroidales bacterium]
MRQIYAIAKAELRVLFYSPIAWLIMIIFSFQAYSSFADLVVFMANKQELSGFVPSITKELYTKFNSVYLVIQNNLYLYIPLLTMGLMSREYSSGSIKLLYSSPLGGIKVILGKYLSIVIFAVVMLGTIVPSIIFTMYKVEAVDLSLLLSGLLGLTLLFFVYASVGLYMSTLSSYQVVVAMLTLGLLALINNMGVIGQNLDGLREITHWLSLKGRTGNFIDGLITSKDIAYFLVIVFIFLSLSVIKLNSGRSKESIGKSILRYSSVVVFAALVAYISSRPNLTLFYDATQNKANTLSDTSIDIIKRLNGRVNITTYVNMADEQHKLGITSSKISDGEKFDRYRRFMPSLKMDYVYYYDEPFKNRNYEAGVTSAEDVARNFLKPLRMNFESLLTPEQIREKVDLKPELNTFVRQVSLENGGSTFLRVYDDFMKYPFEPEISVALLRLIDTVPKVLFLTGSGETSITRYGEKDYTKFTTERGNRSALINQGYDFFTEDIRLVKVEELEKKYDLVVLADPKVKIEGENLRKILSLIERGNNFLITTKPGREQNIKAIADALGVLYLPGTLVSPQQEFAPTLISTSLSPAAFSLSRNFRFLRGQLITMSGALGLDFKLSTPYEIIPLTASPPRGTWNEVESIDFVTEKPIFNRAAGEVQRAISTSFALRKEIKSELGDSLKEQRIVFLGDADCISNSEIGRFRKGLEIANSRFATAIFNWLTYEKFPLNTSKEFTKDNKIYLTFKQARKWKIPLIWTIPILLSLLSMSILYYRKRW